MKPPAQQFKLEYVGNGLYTFIPQHNTSLCVDVPGAGDTNGLNWQVYTSNQSDAQYFSIIANNDGLGTYRIMPLCSNTKVLDIEGPSRSAANLQMWNWTSDAQQMKWFLLEKSAFGVSGLISRNIKLQLVGISTSSDLFNCIKNAVSAWNVSSAGVSITLTTNESPFKIYTISDSSSLAAASTRTNTTGTASEIRINLAKMPSNATEKSFIIAHEIGHLFYLADNPPETNSIMSYTLDKTTSYAPRAYDVSNVKKRYETFFS